MKKDYFSNQMSFYTQFMWRIERLHLDIRETFQREFLTELKKVNPQLNKNKLYIINAIIFEELVTKKSISDYLKKDSGNISRSIDKLIEYKIISKEIIKVEGKETKMLSVNKEFYNNYIKFANAFFERAFKRHFIESLEDICRQTDHEKMHQVVEILKTIK